MARAKNRGYQQTLTPTYTIRRWRLGEYIRLSKEDLKKGKDDSNSVKNQPEYFKNFWDYARGREDSDAFLEAGKKPSGSYVLPTSSATKYDEALKRESLFRSIGTYVYSHSGPSKLLGKHTTDAAAR